MTLVSLILRELWGLFVDDEFLAVAVLVVVALAGLLVWLAAPPMVVGGLLLAGCIAVVITSVLKASRASRP